jgi:hypothetical protein
MNPYTVNVAQGIDIPSFIRINWIRGESVQVQKKRQASITAVPWITLTPYPYEQILAIKSRTNTIQGEKQRWLKKENS